MELDIWVPGLGMGVEYQGEHHYHDFGYVYGPAGTLGLYARRDLKKKERCLEKGITLVTVPYWWDRKKESLAATLSQTLPGIFPSTQHAPIPPTPPNTTNYKSILKDNQISRSLMHGQAWNGEDPTGWIISEKLDGFRAFWNGSKLFTKNGNEFSVPLEFVQGFPRDVLLDGELWNGYDGFSQLASILRKTSQNIENTKNTTDLWKDVKFCVFDAPIHPGHYLERHTFAAKLISGCGPKICTIPIVHCSGLEHLQEQLKETTLKKGEGLMLYHPAAKYTPGRTNLLLKVKEFYEADVKFLGLSAHSYSFLCEQRNGVECVVKCSGWDYLFPPGVGTVVSVRYNGVFGSSKKMRCPSLLRVRPELVWDNISF
eukprot:TRINITY_DN5449_c0_g2_i2.p1 TRINITY_DN5449_c0_g2~~TRINITY_DN5449_c0_g2_i2.p1  ORF type:complete len:371 (-),score=109.93 TRINITY_DN5449_c0_g2_i2:114-1226(-)